MDRRAKERLVGATMLVALIVVVVPELLSGPKRPTQPAAAPTETVRTYTVDLADKLPGTPPTAADSQRAAGDAVAASQPDMKPTGVDPAGATPAGPAAPSGKPPTPSATAGGGTAASGNASAGSDSAGGATPAPGPTPGAARDMSGERGSTPVLPASKPPPPRAAAPPATVESMPASPTSPGVNPARGNAGGWTVQLGSFASEDNAARLAHQLKVQGYPVYVLSSGSGATRRHRVRMGPLSDRDAALRMVAKLKAQGQPAAIVPP